MDNDKLMTAAAQLALNKMRAQAGGPFGAVICRDGEVIAEGWNQVTSSNDPTAHAEIVAIRRACQHLGSFNLSGCSIYTSCEPCPMCLAAIYWARIDKIYYANSKEQAASIGFDDEFLYQEIALPLQQRSLPTEQIPSPIAQQAFDEWRDKPDKIAY